MFWFAEYLRRTRRRRARSLRGYTPKTTANARPATCKFDCDGIFFKSYLTLASFNASSSFVYLILGIERSLCFCSYSPWKISHITQSGKTPGTLSLLSPRRCIWSSIKPSTWLRPWTSSTKPGRGTSPLWRSALATNKENNKLLPIISTVCNKRLLQKNKQTWKF